VGVTVVQLKTRVGEARRRLARNLAGDDEDGIASSTPTGVQVTEYTEVSRRRRRLTAHGDYFDLFDQRWSADELALPTSGESGEEGLEGEKRQLQGSSGLFVTIDLQNEEEELNYFFVPATSANISCASAEVAYNITVTCKVLDAQLQLPVDKSFAFLCPEGTQKRNYSYTCPELVKRPTCKTWDGQRFAVNPACELVSFTSSSTKCSCPVEFVARRRLEVTASARSDLMQITSSAKIIAGGFTRTMSVLDDLEDGPGSGWEKFSRLVEGNTLIFSTMMTIVVLTVLGLAVTVYKDRLQVKVWRDQLQRTRDTRKKREINRNVSEFIDACLPLEYSGLPWYERWWDKIVLEHNWVAVFLPYNPARDFAWVKFTTGMGKIINFMFVDTILAGLFFADDGTCEGFKTESDCGVLVSLDQVDPLCMWSFDQSGYDSAVAQNGGLTVDSNGVPLTEFFSKCQFNSSLGEDFLPTLVLVIVLTTICLPLDRFVEYLVANIVSIFSTHAEDGGDENAVKEAKSDIAIREVKVVEEEEAEKGTEAVTPPDQLISGYHAYAHEIDKQQDMRGMLFRAARLKKMNLMMDSVTADEEADLLVGSGEAHRWRQSHTADIVQHVVDTSRLKQGVLSSATSAFNVATLRMESFYDADSGRQLLVHEKLGDSAGLVHRAIAMARQESEDICKHLSTMHKPADQDTYLLQRFITDSLKGMERNVALRFMFPSDGSEGNSTLFRYFCLLVLVSYLLFCSLYVFLFGVLLGPSSITLWMQGTGYAFLQDVFILQPAKIFVIYILIARIPAKRLRVIHGLLRERAKAVAGRQAGLVRDANSLVQHLSPACRAARKFPELRMARVLISLNDHDIPVNYLVNSSRRRCCSWLDYVLSVVWKLLALVLLLLLLLFPEAIGDSVLEATSNIGINLSIGVGHWLSGYGTVALPVGLFVALVGLFCLYEYRLRRGRTYRAFERPVIKKSDVDYDEVDEIVDRELRQKEEDYLTWRQKLHLQSTKRAKTSTESVKAATQSAKEAQEQDAAPEPAPVSASSRGKSVLADRLAAPSLRIKNLPSVSRLVGMGILPDIFAVSDPVGGSVTGTGTGAESGAESDTPRTADAKAKAGLLHKYIKKYAVAAVAVGTGGKVGGGNSGSEMDEPFRGLADSGSELTDEFGTSRRYSKKPTRSSRKVKNVLSGALSGGAGSGAGLDVKDAKDREADDFAPFASPSSIKIKPRAGAPVSSLLAGYSSPFAVQGPGAGASAGVGETDLFALFDSASPTRESGASASGTGTETMSEVKADAGAGAPPVDDDRRQVRSLRRVHRKVQAAMVVSRGATMGSITAATPLPPLLLPPSAKTDLPADFIPPVMIPDLNLGGRYVSNISAGFEARLPPRTLLPSLTNASAIAAGSSGGAPDKDQDRDAQEEARVRLVQRKSVARGRAGGGVGAGGRFSSRYASRRGAGSGSGSDASPDRSTSTVTYTESVEMHRHSSHVLTDFVQAEHHVEEEMQAAHEASHSRLQHKLHPQGSGGGSSSSSSIDATDAPRQSEGQP
jgi:hypothetical protein